MAQTVSETRCKCGKVRLETEGRPILTATCRCNDCRRSGEALENLPGSPPIVDETGGVSYVLYRKNKVACASGEELLREHRLKEDSPTRRVVAGCCNSFMFLDFSKGHWISMNRERFAESEAVENAPEAESQSVKLLFRLVMDWARTGFGKQTLPFANGRLEKL